MMKKFKRPEWEQRWQDIWARDKIYATPAHKKKGTYILDMFPYPSAQGLHVGHPEGYTASDIYARFLRHKGVPVLHPMGFDAFGLPAENYAIKTGTHPVQTTKDNIHNMRRQIQSLGFSYDWDREVITSDPAYYKWTQWIFVKLFKSGLAYEADAPINWCPKDKTGLANEEVVNGKCDRCGSVVTKKKIKQWLVRITDARYVGRLLRDLDKLDWPENIKLLQRNWIGKSEGADVDFFIFGLKKKITVFTTRPDTLFGATYLVLSPEHPIVDEIVAHAQRKSVAKYCKDALTKSDLERTDLAKEKTGVFTGAYAINPVNDNKIPIWIADYVLSSYGTGAIMAVPAHDERDFAFAHRYKLPIVEVIETKEQLPYTGEGIAKNSGKFTALPTEEFQKKIILWLEKEKKGKMRVNYKLRDWLFSRQRYWGEPIPIIHCSEHGSVAVPEADLPVVLPDIKKYEPTGTGESPLAAIENWVNTTCPTCGKPAKRETNTMPQWAGSNWYFLRYLDPTNEKKLADPKKIKEWMPVDVYIGGAEHAVLHLLYARFIYKFLSDIGVVPKVCGDEPFEKLKNQGLILGEDGQKMSKSRGNVVNPDEVIATYGADVMRMYEMFMGPFEDVKPWNERGLIGVKRFLDRVYSMRERQSKDVSLSQGRERFMHARIKIITDDIENFKFNTAVSEFMTWSNEWGADPIPTKEFETFLILLSPFAPHITEELWHESGHKDSIHHETWPKYEQKIIDAKTTFTVVVMVNGKRRDDFEADKGLSADQIARMAKNRLNVKKWVDGKTIKMEKYIPEKIYTIVVQ